MVNFKKGVAFISRQQQIYLNLIKFNDKLTS